MVMQSIVAMSYGRLTTLIQSIDFSYLESVRIKTVDACIEDVIEKAKEIERNERVDVFVSAGANARILSQGLKKPFVEIRVTGFDILLALEKARQFTKKVAIVTYEKKLPFLSEIEPLLSIKIKQITYRHAVQIGKIIDQLLEEDVSAVIGSSLVLEMAGKRGMRGVFIYSTDSVTRALETAAQIASINKKEAVKAEELRTILNFAYEGIIATDKDGVITVLNPVAEKITNLPKERALKKTIKTVLPKVNLSKIMTGQRTELNQVQSIGGKKYFTNIIPIIVNGMVTGAVVTIKDVASIQEAEEKIRKELYKKGFLVDITFDDIITDCDSMRKLKEQAFSYAQTDLTIVILGETGTAKELFAKSIHKSSLRAQKPFVAINCAAFPETLLESELFGYEEGAFTGARKGGKPGVFELASNGTIFLDEIGEIPLRLQTRLLRVLEEHEVMRIGGDRIKHVDVRVIAATNKDLWKMVEEGRFRDDIYYRLNVLELLIPPLRERREDIPVLVKFFLRKSRPELSEDKLAEISRHPILLEYDWPGNVRELKNIVKRFSVLYTSDTGFSSLITSLFYRRGEQAAHRGYREEIVRTLREVRGNKSLAARKLGISRTTLWRRLKELDA